MNQQSNTIESVANSSEISKIVFKALSDKQRTRRATDLTNLFRTVSKLDQTIPEREFLAVFKKLQDAKVGSLIIGRRSNHNRFVWNYNLKEVAQAAMDKTMLLTPISEHFSNVQKKTKKKTVTIVKPTEVIKPIKKKVIQAKTKSSTVKGPSIQLNLELSPNTPVKEIQALLELVKSLQSK